MPRQIEGRFWSLKLHTVQSVGPVGKAGRGVSVQLRCSQAV